MKKLYSKQKDFLAAFLKTAYIPAEIPPAITTRYFSEFCQTNFTFLKTHQQNLIKITTKYDTFTAPRTASGRRNLALVHPHSQVSLSMLLSEHKNKIKTIISRGKGTLYSVKEDSVRGKAFEGLDFRKWDACTAKICSENSFILKADISRFFYTAYTHSIPWAIVGKEKAKSWLENDKSKLSRHWAHQLDRALQSCQSRETFGFPVGPDTSRIVAELLLSGIESDVQFSSAIQGRMFTRLMDDYVIGFDTEKDANRALSALRSALWKFNLQLNDDKTGICRSSSYYKEKWKVEYDALSINKDDSKQQERDIYNLIDITLHFCKEACSSRPAHWACRRLSEISPNNNFRIIVDALFRLARDFPSCTNHVVAFLINNQMRFYDADTNKRAASWIKSMLRLHASQSHDFEVVWCLCACAALKVSVGIDDVPTEKPSSVVLAILGLLKEKNILVASLSKWDWKSHLKNEGIYGPYWLPFYEAVRRGWTKDESFISEVKRDPLFSRMLAEKVTFLEESIINAREINLIKRTFKKQKKTSVLTNLCFDDLDYG